MAARVKYPKPLKFGLCLVALAIAGLLAFPIAPDSVRYDNATTLYDAHDQALAHYPTQGSYWRFAAESDAIDPNFVKALLAIEDERFYTHSGVDVLAIGRALRTWHKLGEPSSGASTLTMQLVRQYKPRARVFKSKVIESIAALKYELVFSKEEILEQYLTRVSYGGNIQGIKAASWRYFGQNPERLTWDEIALLIALPQAPEARRPDRHPVAAKAGRDRILNKLAKAGMVSDLQALEAMDIPVPRTLYAFPSDNDNGAPLLSARHDDVKSYIDSALQRVAHKTLNKALQHDKSAVNASIVVVESKTHHVIAHVTAGARDHDGGWLDLTQAIRSPGSTLKPFIYGLAMSDGQANVNSSLRDAPTRFGAYQPENFNRRYHGDVRLKDALKHSLNVPAVAALDRVGAARFEQLLASAGATPRVSKKREKESGLSLALGGAGMTSVELATLYTALANKGVAKPLIWTRDQSVSSEAVQILPSDTVKQITSVLASATPPAGRLPGHLSSHRQSVAYKTGTSYGARDSWAAGYTQDYTVVVWVGRPDGAPRPGETGRKSAAPLLFDVFDYLSGSSREELPVMSVKQVEKMPFKTVLDAGPQISFPANGSDVLMKENAKVLRLRAQSSDEIRFYVNGQKLDAKYGAADFSPPSEGFYTLKVIDSQGQTARSRFRVFRSDNIPNPSL